ncbi:hypothetical protein GJ744_009178 [Endocarpon pusillum]|uniref:Uncharacterized protein n=1 Tax=Endocarpon pusillum TaxID=364733 RepID=A0A8H7E4P2_9EURO|nr:hypothetical protein GJ744_009178 [Endocarpon pusillum]
MRRGHQPSTLSSEPSIMTPKNTCPSGNHIWHVWTRALTKPNTGSRNPRSEIPTNDIVKGVRVNCSGTSAA